jgi:hypothetical protein
VRRSVDIFPFAGAGLAVALVSALSCGPKPPAGDETVGVSNPPPPDSDPDPVETKSDAPADAPGGDGVAHASVTDSGEPAVAESPADPLAPLPAAVRKAFEQLPQDPRPDELVRNSHYWVSNEFSHFLWRDEIEDKGGAYLGVGTDQNFLLAGWARSELLIVVDFDAAIVSLHRLYAVLFEEAETPDELVKLWSDDESGRVDALLEAEYGGSDELEGIKKAYKVGRASVFARLRGVKRRYAERNVPTFLSDQDEYDHIRTLWRNGRVFAVRGDYTADKTLVAVGKALHAADVELEVFYLSNVEQYIQYTPEFRRNMIGLPFADDSVVLRTLGWKGFGVVEGETYHYALQPGPNFIGWLKQSRLAEFPKLLYFRTKTDVEGYSKIEREPKVSKRPPEIAE